MLTRFSLYGFLKNQQYYEPFLILAFREKGLSFFMIGILIGFREIATNIMEIPSGAAADIFGRRRSMIVSFAAYIASFVIFGLSRGLPLLFAAMLLFAVGQAFRTGTHKAMIFSWLRARGRESDRAMVYGYTRSWSKLGSALSALVAMGVVIWSGSYNYIFFICIIPYAAGIVNFLGYPAELDTRPHGDISFAAVISHLRDAARHNWTHLPLRRLTFESMAFEGVFKAISDYLQPVLHSAAIAYLATFALFPTNAESPARTALLAGPVYFVLHLLSAAASRNAHKLAASSGNEDRAAARLWIFSAAAYIFMLAATLARLPAAAVAAFVLLYVAQNLWRPIHISRFDTHGPEHSGATTLSIESQAKTLGAAIVAPLLGLAIDAVNTPGATAAQFWPVAAAGTAVSLLIIVVQKVRPITNSQNHPENLVPKP